MRRTLAPLPAAALAAALALSGCVTTGTYEKKEAEARMWKADHEAELAKNKALADKLAVQRAEIEVMQVELRAFQEKVRSTEANLVVKQQELNALREEAVRQQALIDELSKSKKKLEAAKADLEKKSAEYGQLAVSLQTEIEQGRVELSELKGKLTVKMKDKILFASGVSTVGKDGLAALAKVAEALRGVQGKVIRVEGHTDNVPVAAGSGSNWELSAARALAVVRALQERGVDPTKLAAAGYGEYQPIAENETPEGRSLNRRIEIVLAAAQ
ncbi:MAG: OmpA family protein [Anaeromyxobacteraceae bacterium]|nr:OmpA family protein [Anaeromyxobacteraceae bacterium]